MIGIERSVAASPMNDAKSPAAAREHDALDAALVLVR